ncbi:uncharacterized protein LOC127565787 [Drosophila albomicans]|uniref:Uncharacterized protein LOC127565787 n=1 Tax=Drosophila albomicans TaxID=7291 RepID=A0A9C6SZ29_DROAB|nr:uncharacterized protein LOC127565787 [Drosophila albomicans]
MRIRVHTVEGSSLRRTMGGRCKVCKAPTQTDGGQRSAHGRGTADRGRGGRSGSQLPPARCRQSRPNRRRGINPMARTGGTDSVADPEPEGSELLKAMTSCLDAQASVLAVCAGPAGTGQVGPVAAKSSSRRARRRRRGQPAADAVDGDTSRGGVPRKGRGGARRRRASWRGRNVQAANIRTGASASCMKAQPFIGACVGAVG